jgi:hypothetical protein
LPENKRVMNSTITLKMEHPAQRKGKMKGIPTYMWSVFSLRIFYCSLSGDHPYKDVEQTAIIPSKSLALN